MIRQLCAFVFVLLSTYQITTATIRIAPTFHSTGQPCFELDVQAALAQIESADAELAKMVKALKESPIVYQIVRSEGIDISVSTNDKHYILFNPDLHDQYPGEEMCEDPIAGFAHELWHSYQKDKCRRGIGGTFCDPKDLFSLDRNEDRASGILKSEIDAVAHGENLYRLGAGLCLRWKYGVHLLPDPFRPGVAVRCRPLSPDTVCPLPILAGTCSKYCCTLYDYDHKGGKCLHDNLSLPECKQLIQEHGGGGGQDPHPCSEQNIKLYPWCPF